MGIVLAEVRGLLDTWRQAIMVALEANPALLADDQWWRELAASELAPGLETAFFSAMERAVMDSPWAVSWDMINMDVRALAGEMAFELVDPGVPGGLVSPRKRFLIDDIRPRLASGELAWSDLKSTLMDSRLFDEYGARLIARTETTTLWADSHRMAAEAMGIGYKRSIRAEVGRRCPTNVCNDAMAEGWIPIEQEFEQAGTQGPAYHPHCYCYLQFKGELV